MFSEFFKEGLKSCSEKNFKIKKSLEGLKIRDEETFPKAKQQIKQWKLEKQMMRIGDLIFQEQEFQKEVT